MKTVGCDCEDWLTNMKRLEAPAIHEAIRMGRKNAEGVYIAYPTPIKPMSYCAWCGNKLEPIVIFDDRFPVMEYDAGPPLDWSDAP